jgi:hypothetical protein
MNILINKEYNKQYHDKHLNTIKMITEVENITQEDITKIIDFILFTPIDLEDTVNVMLNNYTCWMPFFVNNSALADRCDSTIKNITEKATNNLKITEKNRLVISSILKDSGSTYINSRAVESPHLKINMSSLAAPEIRVFYFDNNFVNESLPTYDDLLTCFSLDYATTIGGIFVNSDGIISLKLTLNIASVIQSLLSQIGNVSCTNTKHKNKNMIKSLLSILSTVFYYSSCIINYLEGINIHLNKMNLKISNYLLKECNLRNYCAFEHLDKLLETTGIGLSVLNKIYRVKLERIIHSAYINNASNLKDTLSRTISAISKLKAFGYNPDENGYFYKEVNIVPKYIISKNTLFLIPEEVANECYVKDMSIRFDSNSNIRFVSENASHPNICRSSGKVCLGDNEDYIRDSWNSFDINALIKGLEYIEKSLLVMNLDSSYWHNTWMKDTKNLRRVDNIDHADIMQSQKSCLRTKPVRRI